MIKRFLKNKLQLAALLAGCFFVSSCENDMQAVKDLSKKTIGVEEAKNIESYLSQGGRMKAKLTAPTMLRYQYDTPKVEFPNSLHVNFFNDSLKVESQLNALYGRYLENENKVFLRDSVVVFNTGGDTILCKELYWDQRMEMFYTDKNVILHQPRQKLYGSGMRAKQDFKSFTLTDPVGFILISDSSFLQQ